MPHPDTKLGGVWTPQAFPLYYQGSGLFQNADGDPSGDVQARADIDTELNNYPHILYAVRIVNTYSLVTEPDGLLPEGMSLIDRLGLLVFDEEQKVRIDFAQQNIITQPLMQSELTGRMNGVHWHMLPSPYLLRGANKIRIELTRVQSYPTLGTAENPFRIIPTAETGLVTAVLVSDLFPAGPPGSTGRPEAGAG